MSRCTLKDLARCSAVFRCLLPSCSHHPGWSGPGYSLVGALSHHQYLVLLPRFLHLCRPRGGYGGNHPHNYPRLP